MKRSFIALLAITLVFGLGTLLTAGSDCCSGDASQAAVKTAAPSCNSSETPCTADCANCPNSASAAALLATAPCDLLATDTATPTAVIATGAVDAAPADAMPADTTEETTDAQDASDADTTEN